MSGVFRSIVARDLLLAARRRIDALLPIAFFVVAVSLFPLGVGPEPQTLRQIAPGVVWVCALLAAMLSLTQLYGLDHADGSLEQMLLSGESLWLIAAAGQAGWLWAAALALAAAVLAFAAFGPMAARALFGAAPEHPFERPDAASAFVIAPTAISGLITLLVLFFVDALAMFLGVGLSP